MAPSGSQNCPAQIINSYSFSVDRFFGTARNQFPESNRSFAVRRLDVFTDVVTDRSESIRPFTQLFVLRELRSTTDNTVRFRKHNLVRNSMLAK